MNTYHIHVSINRTYGKNTGAPNNGSASLLARQFSYSVFILLKNCPGNARNPKWNRLAYRLTILRVGFD